MNTYKKYTEEELVDAYINLIDHSGELNKDFLEIVNTSDYLDKIKGIALRKKLIIKEKGRISFEINKMIRKGKSLEEIDDALVSSVLSNKELSDFILTKYNLHFKAFENDNLTTKLFFKSFVATLIATVVGVSFLLIIALMLKFFIFYFLIPLYIICYFIIKLITGKTRGNIFVFIASFTATVLSVAVIFLLGFKLY